MIHWFARRGRRCALFLGVLAALAFVLLNPALSTQPTDLKEKDSDNDFMNDVYEVFFGLNPTNSTDADLDYDGDALSNIEESKLLTDPFYWDTDRDGFSDLVDSNAVSRAYLPFGDPQFTDGDFCEYAHPDWLLGAYKDGGEWIYNPATTQSCWYVSAYGGYDVSGYGSNGVGTLNIDLDRTILTNNLRYTIHYSIVRHGETTEDSAGINSSLFVDLLDTNGVAVAENLFGNLLTVSNVADYACLPCEATSLQGRSGVIPAEAGIQSNNVILLNIPTAKYPDAAVIQLRACHSRESGNPVLSLADGFPIKSGMTEVKHDGDIFVYEGLLYIDEDGDALDADQECQIGFSDYSIDSNNNGTNDYDECFNTGILTNNPGGGDDGEDDHDGSKPKIIYVDQAIGNDAFTGRASAISASKKGPKKTVRGGLSAAETNDTIIIRSGVYNENLNIQGKDVKVFIEGKVRL